MTKSPRHFAERIQSGRKRLYWIANGVKFVTKFQHIRLNIDFRFESRHSQLKILVTYLLHGKYIAFQQ